MNGTSATAAEAGERSAERPGSRLARFRMPLARHVVEAVAVENGVCVRPLAMRRVNLDTGETEIIPAPCGATLAIKPLVDTGAPGAAPFERSISGGTGQTVQ
jgi:hypothetical protein